MNRNDNLIEVLDETLKIIDDGQYKTDNGYVKLQLTQKELSQVIYYSTNDVGQCVTGVEDLRNYRIKLCTNQFPVVNMDSFSAAQSLKKEHPNKRIMVLNFANPFNPGGGVRYGAIAQEEDLCRKSTLLASLESSDAKIYYDTHNRMKNYFSSDAMLISDKVEVFRDSSNHLLDDPFVVSVLTCAAPYVRDSQEYCITHGQEYEKLLYDRIYGILCVASGYADFLVLGAWGCGAFGNDAKIVSRVFKKCLLDIGALSFDMDGASAFEEVVFAIPDKTGRGYNYSEFKKTFD